MLSKSEQVLEAIKALLITVPNVKIERNTAVPERIPAGGLIVLRDGNPGEPDTALGGFGDAYYSHDVEIELYVEEGDAALRDAAFDTMVQKTGTALETDPTLGGLAFGMAYLSGGRAVPAKADTPADAVERRKKRIRALCLWHFKSGGGPGYCQGCREDGAACVRGGKGITGCLCPYTEHALQSHEEHQAWDVLMACLGQLRLAPSGHVAGIDMNAALKIAEVRGFETGVVSELLQSAENGLVEAMNQKELD